MLMGEFKAVIDGMDYSSLTIKETNFVKKWLKRGMDLSVTKAFMCLILAQYEIKNPNAKKIYLSKDFELFENLTSLTNANKSLYTQLIDPTHVKFKTVCDITSGEAPIVILLFCKYVEIHFLVLEEKIK